MPSDPLHRLVDTAPAIEPLTVEDHLEAPVHPGPSCLAMAMAALEPGREARELFEAMPKTDEPAPGLLALEALRRGFHAILRGPVRDPIRLDEALDAGLVHRNQAAGIRHVLAALEAGRPALVLVDRTDLHEASPSGPHWILAVTGDDESVRYHDPLVDEAPDTIAWEALSDAIGFGHERLLLELGCATRVDR